MFFFRNRVAASIEDVRAVSLDIGFPVMLKAASSGGGGKGIRIVRREQTLNDAFQAVRREAYASFADSRIFVEKYFDSPRHIEVQILADQQGRVVHLYERECSIQRRYQKVVEECPSPGMNEKLRSRMTAAAILAAKSVNYTGAGTVEFLVDKKQNFYFLEMNTRIQVEHSITEMVTGIDLVKEQIFIAAGHPLSIRQEEIACNGSAIECRIYAEDPKNNYLPAPGPVKKLIMPQGPGIRVDCGVFTGWDISRYYDPLIAKLAAWGRSRDEARRRMLRALDECMIFGIKTNLGLHKQILNDDKFKAGKISTGFIEDRINPYQEKEIDDHDLAIITAVCARLQRPTGIHEKAVQSKHDHLDLWRMAGKYQFWATRF